MRQIVSDELIRNIRYYVWKYNSKIDAANKLGLSYHMVLFYSRDIRIKRIKSRESLINPPGVYGKSLELLQELMVHGFVFCKGTYGLKEFLELRDYFPNIRRVKMNGKMIIFFDDRSEKAANALLEVSKKKVMSYQELKQITRVFDTNFSIKEKRKIIEEDIYKKTLKND